MRAIYILSIFLFFWTCSKKIDTNEKQKLVESTQKLNELILIKSEDTITLKQALQIAYAISDKYVDRQHDSLIATVTNLLCRHILANKPKEARLFCQKGLSIGRRQFATSVDVVTRLYRTMALTYYYESDFKASLIYLDSIKTTSQDPAAQDFKISNLLSVAECYHYLNDFKSAEKIIKEVEPLVEKWLINTPLASFHNQYGIILRKLKKYHAAVDRGNQGLSIINKMKATKPISSNDSLIWANILHGIAYAYHDSGAYKLAEPYYLDALTIYKKQKRWDNYKRGLTNLGFLYRFDKQFYKAEKTLTEGISLFKPIESEGSAIRLKASFYVNRSEVYLETKQYNKAIADHDSAIYFFTLYNEKPSLMAMMMQARPVLLSVLKDKATAYFALAENGQDTAGYTKALKLTQQIIDLSDDIRADYFSDDAKLSLANDLKPALEKAIALCHQLYQKTKDKQYLEKAFNFVEYSRSMVLYENARLDNQLSPELKAENEDLKKREAALIAKNNVEELQTYLRLKRLFREKIKALNRNQLASVATCQAELLKDDQTAFVEYFVGDSTIFTFTLLKNALNLYSLPKPKDFEQKIETLREGITQKHPIHDATDFAKQSAELYALLGKECLGNLPSSISKLIMAPDGVLAYLPFELLLKSTPSSQNSDKKQGIVPTDFRQIDYLLKHYQISYAYSANLLLAQKQIKKHNTSRLFAGFAPEYQAKDTAIFAMTSDNTRAVLTRTEAYRLGGAKREVQAISDLVTGKAFFSESATEGVFKKEANQYRILHFAMHSVTDDKDPLLSKLLFTLSSQDTTEDNDLKANEIYTLQLNADLVVLSACNTGYGKLSKGEGVMSLARAFTYAGVPATVTSLWKASDITTPEIMLDFYKNLKLGMSKDAALHQAKLTYLQNAPESVAANPYFWAAFVPLGQMEAMDMSNSPPLSIWGILIGVAALLVLGFWLFKTKFQKIK